MTKLTLYTDGGARGNPGPAAIGGQLYAGEELQAEFSDYIGESTNNWAEYEALARGLGEVVAWRRGHPGEATLVVRMDSELIVKQMRGEYRVKDAGLKKQHARVKELLAQLALTVTFEHVRREQNTEADRLVNEALDARAATL